MLTLLVSNRQSQPRPLVSLASCVHSLDSSDALLGLHPSFPKAAHSAAEDDHLGRTKRRPVSAHEEDVADHNQHQRTTEGDVRPADGEEPVGEHKEDPEGNVYGPERLRTDAELRT